MMFVIAGLILGLIFLFMGADINFALLPLVGGILIQVVPRQYVIGAPPKPRGMTRAEALRWQKEQGYEPLSSAEEKIGHDLDKAWHNKQSCEIAASEGADEYRDADGRWRSITTHEITR